MNLNTSTKRMRAGLLAWLIVGAGGIQAWAADSRPAMTNSLPPGVGSPPSAPVPPRVNARALPSAFSKPIPDSVSDLKAMELHVKSLVARVSPAVVAVEVGTGAGSGVIINGDGLVLTAGHVCGAPHRPVRFTFADGKTAQGWTLGVDRETDTGLMRITNKMVWPHVPVGEAASAKVGDWVLALGHPGGFDAKRSLVVRLGRLITITDGAMQTDCTISPGDSGGPVFDMHGRVIGIHSAISTSTADNFHVPIGQFLKGWDTLAQGRFRRGESTDSAGAYAGVTGETAAVGCRLTSVARNSPAAKAGLKVGDLVLKVDGRDIISFASFERWVAESVPGDSLTLQVKRGDQSLTLTVKLEALPAR